MPSPEIPRPEITSPLPDLVPVRMLNEFAYCPRLSYLEWVQGEWGDSADTLDGVADSALAIANAAVTAGSRAATVKAAVNPFAQVGDLAAARDAFGRLSEALIAYVQAATGAVGGGVNVAYCPMARKRWLQKGEAIANPYYGRKMADCGRIVSADEPPPR